MENKDVFISYSRLDSDIANKICEALDGAGITYFIDRQGIGGGMEFPDILAEAILNCKVFLYLASNNSYNSKYTKAEITFAFNEKPHNSLLPYIIDDSSLPLSMKLVFSSINWRNIKEHPIETVLIDDICHLLGKERAVVKSSKNNKREEDCLQGSSKDNIRDFVHGLLDESFRSIKTSKNKVGEA